MTITWKLFESSRLSSENTLTCNCDYEPFTTRRSCVCQSSYSHTCTRESVTSLAQRFACHRKQQQQLALHCNHLHQHAMIWEHHLLRFRLLGPFQMSCHEKKHSMIIWVSLAIGRQLSFQLLIIGAVSNHADGNTASMLQDLPAILRVMDLHFFACFLLSSVCFASLLNKPRRTHGGGGLAVITQSTCGAPSFVRSCRRYYSSRWLHTSTPWTQCFSDKTDALGNRLDEPLCAGAVASSSADLTTCFCLSLLSEMLSNDLLPLSEASPQPSLLFPHFCLNIWFFLQKEATLEHEKKETRTNSGPDDNL